jgi:uncharacterized protein
MTRRSDFRATREYRCPFDLLGIKDKELFWIEGTTRRFKDGYKYFGRHPEKILAFFDKHMK